MHELTMNIREYSIRNIWARSMIHSCRALIKRAHSHQPIHLQRPFTRQNAVQSLLHKSSRPRTRLLSPASTARGSSRSNTFALTRLVALFAFAAVAARACRAVFVVQVVCFDVGHHWLGDKIADGHVATAEQADLSGGYVVLDQLLDDPNVVLPFLQGGEGFVYVRASALEYFLVSCLVRNMY